MKLSILYIPEDALLCVCIHILYYLSIQWNRIKKKYWKKKCVCVCVCVLYGCNDLLLKFVFIFNLNNRGPPKSGDIHITRMYVYVCTSCVWVRVWSVNVCNILKNENQTKYLKNKSTVFPFPPCSLLIF